MHWFGGNGCLVCLQLGFIGLDLGLVGRKGGFIGGQRGGIACDHRTTRHKGYAPSIKKRKLVEENIGWAKTVGGVRKARFVGLAKLKMQALFTFAAFNLTRITSLLGWPLSNVPRPKSASWAGKAGKCVKFDGK